MCSDTDDQIDQNSVNKYFRNKADSLQVFLWLLEVTHSSNVSNVFFGVQKYEVIGYVASMAHEK